jgi:hypothetical protein
MTDLCAPMLHDLAGQRGQVERRLVPNRVYLKTPRSLRTIEITPALAAELRKHRLAAPALRSSDHDFVFLSRAGTACDHRNVGGRVLERALKAAKLSAVERDGVACSPLRRFMTCVIRMPLQRHGHRAGQPGAGTHQWP